VGGLAGVVRLAGVVKLAGVGGLTWVPGVARVGDSIHLSSTVVFLFSCFHVFILSYCHIVML
jgi:hypothetical protein